jgi:hypothetical protein
MRAKNIEGGRVAQRAIAPKALDLDLLRFGQQILELERDVGAKTQNGRGSYSTTHITSTPTLASQAAMMSW